MEETQVLIVGAGPSGLTLGLALAKFQVRVEAPIGILLNDHC